MIGFDQKPNDRRRLEGIIRRLEKERKLLDKMQDKYEAIGNGYDLEEYALQTLSTLEKTLSPFIDYKGANKASKDDRTGRL